jgi:hypothetical protein
MSDLAIEIENEGIDLNQIDMTDVQEFAEEYEYKHGRNVSTLEAIKLIYK